MDVRSLNGSRPEGQSAAGWQVVHGYVSLQRPAPTKFSDPLYVIVPAHSGDTPYGPLPWPALHGATLPAQGAPVTLGLGVGLDGTPNVPAVIGWDAPYAIPSGLPAFVSFGAITLIYPGGQGFTPAANITPPGAPTGTCYAVASCQTDSTGQGRNVATISANTGAVFVNANTIDGSNPAAGTTVLAIYVSWALS